MGKKLVNVKKERRFFREIREIPRAFFKPRFQDDSFFADRNHYFHCSNIF